MEAVKQLKLWAEKSGILLSGDMCAQFSLYEHMLVEWNKRINLTAITDPLEIARKHFLDSLLLLHIVEVPFDAALLDVGTGGGMPGVPLKIARPDLSLSLLDSLGKRLAFLKDLSDALGQQNTLLHGRAEELAHRSELRESFDVVTARAVAALPALCELCLPFVKQGGIFAAMKGPDCAQEVRLAERAIMLLGGELQRVGHFDLPIEGGRSVIVIKKSSRTPSSYPRKGKKVTGTPL